MLAEVDDEIAEAKLDLAENLETLLAEKGWQKLTITEITQRLNHDLSNCRLIGSTSLRNWRLGKTLPTYGMLLALADRIDCYPTDLLTTKQQGLLRVTKDKK